MLLNVGFMWLAMAVAAVVIVSFIVATALHAVVGDEGFGATGNAAVMAAGFFAGIYIANSLGYRLADVRQAIPVGVGGAFALFGLLVVLKAAMRRLVG